jgi:hypothetical protein
MLRQHEQHSIVGEAKRTTTTTAPFGLLGRGTPSLFRNDHGQNPNNHPAATSLPIPAKTAGEKRQTAIAAIAPSENHYFFSSQAGNKRHCNETTKSRPRRGDPGACALNPKKRSGGVLVVANQHHHNHNQQQLQQHYFSPSSRAVVVVSDKKVKTENCSRMDDDANMVICEDEPEPKPKHHDVARDVWDFIGVG